MTNPILSLPIFRAFDAAGVPLAGGHLYTYAANSLTQKTTYASADNSSPNANPVVLDTSGTAVVRLGSGAYKFVLKDSTDATTYWTVDNYQSSYLTQADIGGLLWPQTSAETSASVTPTYYYKPSDDAAEAVDPRRFGFTGSVSATDTTAFQAALNVADQFNGIVFLPAAFTANAQLTWPANVGIVGRGRSTSVITKGFNGDLFASMPAGAWMQDIGLEGAGGTYTGKLLNLTGTDGKQSAIRCDIANAQDACIAFATSAGSQSSWINCRIARYSGTTSDAYCAVVIDPTQQLSAKPRKFVNCETDGTYFIDFGGSNNTYVIGCFSGGYKFGAESRGVFIADGRWANQTSCTVNGHQVTIVGGDILPDLTTTGSGPFIIGPANFNGTVTDGSSAGTSTIYVKSVSYTPTWTGSVGNPAIVDGTLRGEYSRQGDVITMSVELIIGASTTMGTGTWRFSVPVSPIVTSGTVQSTAVYIFDSGTTSYIGFARLANSGTYVDIQLEGGTSVVDATHPMTWAVDDSLRFTITYIV